MYSLRFVAAGCVLLTLYYARFFLFVRQESTTLLQIVILLAAAAILSLSVPFGVRGGRWFRKWRPVSIQGWLTWLVGLGLAVAVFAWADHDSHSASDTLTRSVPTLCLIAAVLLRLTFHLDERRRAGRQPPTGFYNPGGAHS